MSSMHVSELYVYPLKSARGLCVPEVSFTQRGPLMDRHWMVIDRNNRFLSQRKYPVMCLIETRLDNATLTLNAPAMSPFQLDSDCTLNETRQVTVWHDSVTAADCGDAAAQWLSTYLGVECRLVAMPAATQRLVDPQYAHQQQHVGFADGFPSLIISQASLDDFNQKLASPISMARFRPNIVIGGCAPYAEDEWQSIKIGDLTLSLVKPCSRCIMPAIDPSDGSKQMAVIEALNQYRRRDRKTYFGQNALHDGVGAIRVGDPVELLS